MNIKEEAKNIALVCFLAIVLIIGIKAYNFFQSKFSKHINPEAIVVIGNIQIEALNSDLNKNIDEELKTITTSVINISKQEENLTFEEVYERIEKLEYYDLPPLYWEQLYESQKIKSFKVWEDYMTHLMSQCYGTENIKLSPEQTEQCIKQKKIQIERKKKLLFEK